MPLLAFAKQRFHPHLALVHGFLVGKGLLVALHSFHIVCKKGPVDVPTAGAFSTLRFYWADITDRGIGTVLDLLCSFHSICWTQDVSLRAAILILAGIVDK